MKNKIPNPTSDPNQDEAIRTTISFSKVVWDMAQKQMQARGFNNNLSAYLADLTRRDEERSIELEAMRSARAGERKQEQAAPAMGSKMTHTPASKKKGKGSGHSAALGQPERVILGFRPMGGIALPIYSQMTEVVPPGTVTDFIVPAVGAPMA